MYPLLAAAPSWNLRYLHVHHEQPETRECLRYKPRGFMTLSIQFYRWGLCGMLVLLAECALLGALGAFDIARFNVWPFFGRNHGRAICEMLLPGRCYCQE